MITIGGALLVLALVEINSIFLKRRKKKEDFKKDWKKLPYNEKVPWALRRPVETHYDPPIRPKE
jgi:hypothetical protein